MERQTSRLEPVDGLRAIAIMWVVAFHYAVFWAPSGNENPLLPYGDALAGLPLASIGYLGVFLFFIVSGFVISFSLTRASGHIEFARLRAIRLWPTLVICGSITFGLTTWLGPDQLIRSPWEYLVSMTFFPPAHVGKLIGEPGMQWLDGAYWSLWTEVRFYIIAALLYFASPRRFLLSWTVFAFICALVYIAGLASGGAWAAAAKFLFAKHQPFFTAGIALAAMRSGQHRKPATLLFVAAFLQAVSYFLLSDGLQIRGVSVELAIGILLTFALGAIGTLAQRPVPFLSLRWVVIIGQSSYAYYLLHQNTGLALLTALVPEQASPQFGVAIMLASQLALMAFSVFLTLRIEAPLRRVLRKRARKTKPTPKFATIASKRSVGR